MSSIAKVPVAGAAEAGVWVPEWQPIETAPKDGSRIDLWVDDERRALCYWSLDEDATEGDDDSHWRQHYAEVSHSSFALDGEPTHWMPLPAPP